MKKYHKSTLGFRQFFDIDSSTFTYLIFDPDSMEGIIIDPVEERFDRNVKFIRELGVILKYVIDTHVHADHVTSSGMLSKVTGAKRVLGEMSEVECADILIKDSDKLNFGRFTLTAISTPGHTDSCTSFYAEDRLFTGDSLLIRSCGRTDFQQGDPKKLFESITQKLYLFPGKTLVYPGHDYLGRTVSSIREEKIFNPRINDRQTLKEFVKIMNNLILPQPEKIEEIVHLNLKCGYSSDHS